MLISYKENKKGINQFQIGLSPFVASTELDANQIWKDLREFHSLVVVLEKFLKFKKAGY